MARYRIEQGGTELTIRVTEVQSGGDRLLAAFRECKEGRCDCPTDEYEKISAFGVNNDESESITLQLVPKPDERFDEAEVDACLKHTIAKTEG